MNKPQTLASYEVRLNRVVDHIYSHLDEDLRLEDLAEVACLSPYHWHRIYTALRGETVTATIRRLRLARAADRLANSAEPVDAVAGRAGYEAADAFVKAFKEAYGKTPTAYRSTGSHASFQKATQAQDATGFPVEVVTLPPLRCAAVSHAGAYMHIDKAMARLFSALSAQRLPLVQPTMMGVFFDDPDLVAVEHLRSQACTPIADNAVIAPPLEAAVLRGSAYARLRYTGPYADMKGAYRWLLGAWLPQSNREADDAPVFEAYLNSPVDVPPTQLRTDIHLPLRDRA